MMYSLSVTNDDDNPNGQSALRDHAQRTAQAGRARYGPAIDLYTIIRILDDRMVVRYPVELAFDSSALEPGEFGHASPLGNHPDEGFRLSIHPFFEHKIENLPLLIAYHIVSVNYGDIATHEEAERFGAALLGIDQESYYQELCRLADGMNESPA